MPTPADDTIPQSQVPQWSHTGLKTLLLEFDVTHFGVVPLKAPLTAERYELWLERGYHGDLRYMKDRAAERLHPRQYRPHMNSALVMAIPYIEKTDHPDSNKRLASSQAQETATKLRIASYARFRDGLDYHKSLRAQFEPLISKLESSFHGHSFEWFVDTAPILERDLAFRAGLGWFGKNTCLIDRKQGSFFFITEIYSSLKIDEVNHTAGLAKGVSPDFCGTCTRCVDACPTRALTSDRMLQADRCISYWTIESKTVPPEDLRTRFEDWFFGCDVCQTVCPWNEKVFGRAQMQSMTRGLQNQSSTARTELSQELIEILLSSGSLLQKKWQSTALSRARGFGLKRNALIVIANCHLTECSNAVSSLLQTTTDPRLVELAEWTLTKLGASLPHSERGTF